MSFRKLYIRPGFLFFMDIKEAFSKIEKLHEYVALAVVEANKYQKTNVDLVKSFTDKKIPGVYVTLSKPYETVSKNFKQKGVNTDLILFIDGITKTTRVEKKDNCLFIGSPENLSDISIAMDQAVNAIPKRKFVFFDSLSVLLLYNDPLSVARFIHFLAGKMHTWKVKGIIVTLKRKEDEELIKEIIQFCDLMFSIK
jgi:KaiC/GvpD/RAD55 family RecA-like ATPase